MEIASLFGKPDCLKELVVRVAIYNRNESPSGLEKVPRVMAMHVPSRLTVRELRQRVLGRHVVPYETQFAFRGRELRDEEALPQDCFEAAQGVDEEAELFRARIVMLVDCAAPLAKPENALEAAAQEAAAEQLPLEAAHELQDVDWKADRQLLVEEHFASVFQKSSFDLLSELKQIKCEQFYEALESNGFDNEGAFALLTEADFAEGKMWIPVRAQKRILALAAHAQSRLSPNAMRRKPSLQKAKPANQSISVMKTLISKRGSEINDDLVDGDLSRHTDQYDSCPLQENLVLKRENTLLELGAARFCAKLRVFLDGLPRYSDDDLAQFEPMFHQVVKAIEDQHPTVQIDLLALRSYLKNVSGLNIREIQMHEYCAAADISLIPPRIFSKNKCIEGVKQFILENNPIFLLEC